MKVVILAGGYGTRLSEYTQTIPKPMLEIHGKPILIHLIENYSRQGFNDFIIALGYKSSYIKNYFLEKLRTEGNVSIDFSKRKFVNKNLKNIPYKVDLIDTGNNAETGDRIRNLKPYLKKRFMLTYGDGLSNVNIKKLIKFHESQKTVATITAVRPRARFGSIEISGNGKIKDFKEKLQTKFGRINGGFMVMEPEIFNFFKPENCILEREPLEKLTSLGLLSAFKHDGFWHCIDTKRDLDEANSFDPKKYPWTMI